MLNLDPWVEFTDNLILSASDFDRRGRSDEDLLFIVVNVISYVLTKMITAILEIYCTNSNVLNKVAHRINMKNEFFFTKMILANKKKRYLSSIKLKEGKELKPEKIDIKGHDFIKSSIREETKEFFETLIKDELLYTDDISIGKIIGKLKCFEDNIVEGLREGEKAFLIPKNVKEPAAYADPFKEQSLRAVMAWNAAYPDKTQELPVKLDLVKVNLETMEDLAPLKETEPEIYERLVKDIFNNKVEKVRDKGIMSIAIPRSEKSIPEWIIPYIDYDTIVNDNISKFHSVLASLGVGTIRTSTKQYYSNIISF